MQAIRQVLGVSVLCCGACSPTAQDPPAQAPAARGPAEQIGVLMRAYDGAVPGAGVLVLRDGAPIFRRAYGLSNVESRAPAVPETNYRLASMTKQFTAAAI